METKNVDDLQVGVILQSVAISLARVHVLPVEIRERRSYMHSHCALGSAKEERTCSIPSPPAISLSQTEWTRDHHLLGAEHTHTRAHTHAGDHSCSHGA